MKKSDLNKKLNELVDKNLNLIGHNDDVDSAEEVKANSTTDSHADTSGQQMGKDRTNALYAMDIANNLLETENIVEDNSQLVGKTYSVPLNVKQFLQTKSGEGIDRINWLLKNNPNYNQLKRFKYDIENNYQSDWSPILGWINGILNKDTSIIKDKKTTTMETGMENRFRKTHDKQHGNNLTPLTEKIKITETQAKLLVKEIIIESENYNLYKLSTLRDLLNQKTDLIMNTKEEIKKIQTIINNRKPKQSIDIN